TFMITGTSSGGRREYFQQQVFPYRQAHLIGSEDLLFSKVSRERLKAPPLVSRFHEGSFECQICEYGSSQVLSPGQYLKVLPEMLADLWCFKPPRQLLAAFNTARAALPLRMTVDLVDRLSFAAISMVDISLFEE